MCVCESVGASVYMYTSVYGYNVIHVYIYPHISAVYWWEGVRQRKSVRKGENGFGGDRKRFVRIRMIYFFF